MGKLGYYYYFGFVCVCKTRPILLFDCKERKWKTWMHCRIILYLWRTMMVTNTVPSDLRLRWNLLPLSIMVIKLRWWMKELIIISKGQTVASPSTCEVTIQVKRDIKKTTLHSYMYQCITIACSCVESLR